MSEGREEKRLISNFFAPFASLRLKHFLLVLGFTKSKNKDLGRDNP